MSRDSVKSKSSGNDPKQMYEKREFERFVMYRNASGWVRLQLFLDIIKDLNKKMQSENRKVILLMDNYRKVFIQKPSISYL